MYSVWPLRTDPGPMGRNDREAGKIVLILKAFEKGKKLPGEVASSLSLEVCGKRLDLIFCLANLPSFILIPIGSY